MKEEQLINLPFPKLQPFYYADGTGGWLLLEDFESDYCLNGVYYKIVVKKDFDYDGASIPRICRTLVGDKMAHDIIVGALFHDILYCVHDPLFNRKEADKLITHFIGRYDGSFAKQAAVYRALRTFGGIAWNREDEIDSSKTIRYKNFFVYSRSDYDGKTI